MLAVEKPGVEFAYQPPHSGVAEGGPKAFLEEHTLERWTEANRAALLATRKLPGIKGGPELVMGHSEGGLVAACVGASTPGVTHVANMSGGGPSQLYDFTQIMPADEVYFSRELGIAFSPDPRDREVLVILSVLRNYVVHEGASDRPATERHRRKLAALCAGQRVFRVAGWDNWVVVEEEFFVRAFQVVKSVVEALIDEKKKPFSIRVRG